MKKPIRTAGSRVSAPRTHGGSRSAAPARRRAPSNAELVHELEVHQVELEMQNEELRHAQLDLQAARDRFVDLYDFAPVGYFTLDARGLVTEANLTGAAMFGVGRKAMLGRGLSRFVAPAYATLWHQNMRQAMQQDSPHRIELELKKSGGESFFGQLDCAVSAPPAQSRSLRVTLTDITQRKMAEMERRIADSAQDAREAERRQVARELHEGLGQRLSALKMELGSLPVQGDAPGVHARVAMMQDMLDESLASVRRIALELRPLMLDDLGLGAAIEWLVQDTMRRPGIAIALDLRDIEPAPEERCAIAMYRLAQDLLDFIAHQATVASLTMTLMPDDGELLLKIRCQGASRTGDRGGAPANARTQHLLDRAHSMGGHIELRDSPTHGLSIVARMPMVRQCAEPQLSASQRATRATAAPRTRPKPGKARP